jgi:hypothetical protein
LIRIKVTVYEEASRPRQRRLVLAAEGTSARPANSDALLDLLDALELAEAQMGEPLSWRIQPLPIVGSGNVDQARYEFARQGVLSPKPADQAQADLADLATVEDLAQGPDQAPDPDPKVNKEFSALTNPEKEGDHAS